MDTTNSKPIYDKYRKLHTNVFLFPQPSNTSNYLKYNPQQLQKPFDLKNIPKPIVGFIGSFFDWKVDLLLIDRILAEYPNVSFVVIGLTNISREWMSKFKKKGIFITWDLEIGRVYHSTFIISIFV